MRSTTTGVCRLNYDAYPLNSDGNPLDNDAYPLNSGGNPLNYDAYPLIYDVYPLDSEPNPLIPGLPSRNVHLKRSAFCEMLLPRCAWWDR